LSDDFSAIVLGIEEGRKIYDNLKRAIIYCLCANIAELTPFLALIILGYPLPMSSILVLCIDLGFNIFPAISFASEESEIDIMVRPPRTKSDHLVTKRLLTSAYITNGLFESFGGFLSYFIIMQDFGFPWQSLYRLGLAVAFQPGPTDVWDPSAPFNGMTNQQFIDYCTNCQDSKGPCDPNDLPSDATSGIPDWIYNQNSTVDLRLAFLQCNNNHQPLTTLVDGSCAVPQISARTGLPVCFSTEALKYAQTGFYLSVALCQFSLIFVVKTRRQSFMTSGLTNFSMIFGFASIIIVCLFICYFEPFNNGLNSREVIFLHWGLPSIPLGIYMLLYDEVRKYFVRNSKAPADKPSNWFERNTVW
jgi:sodium/potassium-transporting ATPase subunit alpha